MDLWREIGAQLRHPTGLPGSLTGNVMGLVNRKANALAVETLRIKRSDTILELGFGPGHAIKTMAAMAPLGRIWGVDQSPVMIEQARKRNLRTIQSGRVVLHQCGFDALPIADASVDKVLAVNVIYFWKDANAVLQDVRRVLRPRGRVAIYATDAETMRHWRFAGPDTHRLFTADVLGDLLRCGGFGQDTIEIKSVCAGPGVTGLIATACKRETNLGKMGSCDRLAQYSIEASR